MRTATLIGGMAASVALAAAAVAQPAFEFIPTPPGAQMGSITSRVWGVSSDGQTVAGTVSTSSGLRGWRWRSGVGRTDYAPPAYPFNSIAVTGLSGDGSAVVGEVVASGVNTVFRSVNDGTFDIYTVPTGYDALVFPRSNVDGSVVAVNAQTLGVGGSVLSNRAVRYTSPTTYDFVPAPAGADVSNYIVNDISSNSRIVGFATDTNRGDQRHATIWDEANGARWLPVTGSANGSGVTAISRGGDAIAGVINEPGERPKLARWIGSDLITATMPTTPAYTGLSASSISDDGRIIAGELGGDGISFGNRGFIWTQETGIVEVTEYLLSVGVEFPTSSTLQVRGVFLPVISADGRYLSGTVDYINPQTNRVTLQFFTVVVPSPSTLLGAMSGFILAVRHRRRSPDA